MKELMTEREKTTNLKRLQVAAALEQGWTYKQIQETFEVSSATISLVKRLIKDEGKRWSE